MKLELTSSEILALREVDAKNAELRARNKERLVAAKAALGTKYLLHPDNAPEKTEYRAVLQHAQE